MHVIAAILAALLATSAAIAATSPLPSADPAAPAEPVPFLEWEVVSRRPHDAEAFTQGLLLGDDGRLFESTGQYGQSTLREVDPSSGELLRLRSQPDSQFSEGLALVGDELIQLTWKRGLARRYDADTFQHRTAPPLRGRGLGPVLRRRAPGHERRQRRAHLP